MNQCSAKKMPQVVAVEGEFISSKSVRGQAAKIDVAFLKDDDPDAFAVLRALALLPLRRGYSEVIADLLSDEEDGPLGNNSYVDAKLNLLGQLDLAAQAPVKWSSVHDGGAVRVTSQNWAITDKGRECIAVHEGRQ